jgi:exopolysaccharide production protein ExoZ
MRGIDACRGLAAIMVVCVHTVSCVSQAKYLGLDPTNGASNFCLRGVDFFFVLSGFIITYVHWNDLGDQSKIGSFLYKRFVRLYPMLWIVAVPSILLGVILKVDDLPGDVGRLVDCVVSSLIAIPSAIRPYPPIVWTLKHEVFFYGLFVCALWKPRWAAVLMVAWGFASVIHSQRGVHDNFLLDFALSCYNLEFLFGVACAVVLRLTRVPYPGVVALMGFVAFGGAAMVFEVPQFDRPWIVNGSTLVQALQFGLASAMIVLGVGQLDLDRTSYVPPFAELLGAASYSIYLVHGLALGVIVRVLMIPHRMVPLPAGLFMLLLLCGAVAAGVLLHLLVEKPVMALLRPRSLPGPSKAMADGTEVSRGDSPVQMASVPAKESAVSPS